MRTCFSWSRRASAAFIFRFGAFDSECLGRLAAGALLFLTAYSALAATFNVADGDVAGLKNAITTANGNNQNDTIILAAGGGGTYTLTEVDNFNNGLPVIRADNGHALTIDGGSGATIQRAA